MDKKVKSADSKGDDDEHSYEVSLDEDFLTSLEYGMPPASGMVRYLKIVCNCFPPYGLPFIALASFHSTLCSVSLLNYVACAI